MRKAILQTSSRARTREEAEDELAGILGSAKELGVEAAWITSDDRVAFIAANISGIETTSQADLKPGQRLVYLPDADSVQAGLAAHAA
jgi:hypothetical protein